MDAITIDDFSFSYPNGKTVLSHADCHVPAGAFALLMGRTGSGKSTLLRCLKPELTPAGNKTGTAVVHNIASERTDEGAGRIGFVMQDPANQIVCDTVWHELAFGLENAGVSPDIMRRRVAEVAHFFGMEPWMNKATDALSGGQQQMLNVASALVMRPQVLLLDEPASQLDPVAEKNLLHMLFRVNRELGITVVVATHAPGTMADYATCAFRLEQGGIHSAPLPSALQALSMEAAAEYREPVEPGATTLSLSDVYARYTRTSAWVLRGMDLNVTAGSIHALVGGNGCGKSTTLQALAGLMSPERGKVHNNATGRQVLLPQDPRALFVCDTVDEELREWQDRCGYSDADVHDVVAECGIESVLDQHPYDVSGGQRQMVALAKLLLVCPRLMLLDEPTKGLDTSAKYAVAQLLAQRCAQGVTVVMATHDLSFAACVADTASLLFDGQAVCTEPITAFFEANLFYAPVADEFACEWMNRKAESGRQ